MNNERRETLASATVAVLLEMRQAYLAGGGNALKHWAQIQDRLRAACRTSETVEQWLTTMQRGLQLPAASSSLSSAAVALAKSVGTDAAAWLDMVESEHGYIIALARLESEERKKRRDAARGD